MPATSLARHPRPAPEPPALRCLTVNQIEAMHPGCAGRVRGWIKRADAGDPAFHQLKLAVARVGRSVLIDEIRFTNWLYESTAGVPAPARNREHVSVPGAARRSRRTT